MIVDNIKRQFRERNAIKQQNGGPDYMEALVLNLCESMESIARSLEYSADSKRHERSKSLW